MNTIYIKLTLAFALLWPSIHTVSASVLINDDATKMSGKIVQVRYSASPSEFIRSFTDANMVSFYGTSDDGRFFSCYIREDNPYLTLEKARTISNNYRNGSYVSIERALNSNECMAILHSYSGHEVRLLNPQ